MGDFVTELEIVQGENFALKAPKGFKVEAWNSRSGRPGEVLYSKFSPDYMSSDCYITVSTVARDPIVSEVRKRIERHIGEDGFNFEFKTVGDRHVVLYFHEAEADYKSYHAFILLNEKKAVMMDVVFNVAFDNSKDIAFAVIESIRTNFNEEASDEELAADAARLEAEDKADAAKEAARKAQLEAASGKVNEEPEVEVAEMVEMVEEPASQPAAPVEENPVTPSAVTEASVASSTAEESPVDTAAPVETTEPEFGDSEEDRQKKIIYEEMKNHNRMTLSELQTVPELVDLGRMGITKLMNTMIRDQLLVRIEETDNIYFALPGKGQPDTPEVAASVETEETSSDLDPMEQYKIDMEKYKAAMKEWKNSKDFFGRTDMPKPVEPVKPKKKK